MESYAAALEATRGVIAEFVNPKYKDSSKQAFKSPTRLECMLQDFPRALPPSAAIGFTVINQVGLGDTSPGGGGLSMVSDAGISLQCIPPTFQLPTFPLGEKASPILDRSSTDGNCQACHP